MSVSLTKRPSIVAAFEERQLDRQLDEHLHRITSQAVELNPWPKLWQRRPFSPRPSTPLVILNPAAQRRAAIRRAKLAGPHGSRV